jgi:hypothetical protein
MDSPSDSEKINQIINYLGNIESRISRLEARLDIELSSSTSDLKQSPIFSNSISVNTDSLENQIGQFWFAKVGTVILTIGIIFLLTFPYQNLPPALPGMAGFLFSGILFLLSLYWRDSLKFLSQYIFGSALLLLFFSTLRMHYFGKNPAIDNLALEMTILIFVTILHLIISYKRKSVYLTALGLTFAAVTALISNNFYSIFILLMILSLLIVFLKLKYEWNGILIFGIIIVYLTELLWVINNPLIGNKVELQNPHYLFVVSLILFSVIFASANFLRANKEKEDSIVIVSTLLNCSLSYTCFFFITLIKFNDVAALSNLAASIIFISLSILFYLKEESKYSTFVYSMLGYLALSVAIISQFPKPDFFVWLCWQSLIVISTAIWFRSKIIIVANFIMYLMIFFAYLAMADKISVVTLGFGIVALLSARILNWKKDRLDLKTEVMRLFYLGAAFFIFPYALFFIVPKDYISLSWTIVAVFYYIVSVILKNRKYRWMAILTFLLTIIYILLVGSTGSESIFRIISFIVLGFVLLIISIFYGKMKSKKELQP